MLTAVEILGQHRIITKSSAEGRQYAVCPECSHKRTKPNQKLKCLGITIDATGVMWGCNHCGWKGGGKYDTTGKLNGNGAAAPRTKPAGASRMEILEAYDYVDENGRLLFQSVRFVYRCHDGSLELAESGKPRKTFRQRRPDPGDRDRWIWGLAPGDYMRRGPREDWYRFDEERWAKLPASRERKPIAAAVDVVPYRLPDLIEAASLGRRVLVVEGEQKVDALDRLGVTATCNAEGAGKWTAEHAVHLRGAHVVILPDNDPRGREHAEVVAHSLQSIAASVRVLDLAQHWPECPAKGDVVDWINAGGTREQLDDLLGRAIEWRAREPAAPIHQPQQRLQAFSAKELHTMRFEPIKYIVPGIIVEGLTLLAAKPKMGKSWMMLHAAAAVASGGFTLGNIKCAQGRGLYAALEDNKRRLQSRMTKLFGMQPWPEALEFCCEMPRLVEGGLAYIREWLTNADNPRFVIIDTLAMVRAPKKRDESNYEADYAAVKDLRALANEFGVAIVLVHHLRKQDSDDAFDTISGTLGLTGAPNSILVLKRDSNGGIVLHGRGRDLVEIEKAMTFNTDTCVWTIAGEVREVRTSNQRKTILAAMREIELPASPADIAAATQMKHANVKQLLLKMIDDSTVRKASYGKYDLAEAEQPA